tara:strand:+ start:5963 stop:6931 length:969 start_codon:yes stop_codon:yes gene_type:complete
MENLFFKKEKKITINDVLVTLGQKQIKKNFLINDIKDLESAKLNDVSFLHSKKYFKLVENTKSKIIITNPKFKTLVPKNKYIIEVHDVLLSVAKITSIFYPNSLDDNFDSSVVPIEKLRISSLKFGKNILVGKKVKIGKNCSIGHNTIIEKNVIVGNNCKIGNNVLLKNCVVGNNTNILDGAIIGKKGFGFNPGKINFRYPHVGSVIIGNYVEIGCNNTIDRGSLSDTIIGDGTFLDNQVHIAHNVKIGKNCIITGQVGFAGSSTIGNQVMIGGQAGISGHLNIGDNVKIGGGSGVITDIPSNTKVMGYPAKNIRDFVKESK